MNISEKIKSFFRPSESNMDLSSLAINIPEGTPDMSQAPKPVSSGCWLNARPSGKKEEEKPKVVQKRSLTQESSPAYLDWQFNRWVCLITTGEVKGKPELKNNAVSLLNRKTDLGYTFLHLAIPCSGGHTFPYIVSLYQDHPEYLEEVLGFVTAEGHTCLSLAIFFSPSLVDDHYRDHLITILKLYLQRHYSLLEKVLEQLLVFSESNTVIPQGSYGVETAIPIIVQHIKDNQSPLEYAEAFLTFFWRQHAHHSSVVLLSGYVDQISSHEHDYRFLKSKSGRNV